MNQWISFSMEMSIDDKAGIEYISTLCGFYGEHETTM